MNAFILAAGLGTRLRPLTDSMPKALVPVGGKPLIRILIERLKADGFTHVVVNVHHFAEQIVNYLNANQNFGIDIQLSDETGQLLETGGAIKKAGKLFGNGEPFLVHNVDILHNIDLAQFYREEARRGEAVLLTSPRKTQRYLVFDNSRLVGWTNIATGEIKSPFPGAFARIEEKVKNGRGSIHLSAFSGIHIFPSEMLSAMDSWPDKFSIIDFYLKTCVHGSVRGIEHKDLKLVDVGKLDTLAAAEDFLTNQI